jgi:hypothetical protein
MQGFVTKKAIISDCLSLFYLRLASSRILRTEYIHHCHCLGGYLFVAYFMKSNLAFSFHVGFAIIHSQSYSLIEVHILSTNSSALLYFLASSYSGWSSLFALSESSLSQIEGFASSRILRVIGSESLSHTLNLNHSLSKKLLLLGFNC